MQRVNGRVHDSVQTSMRIVAGCPGHNANWARIPGAQGQESHFKHKYDNAA